MPYSVTKTQDTDQGRVWIYYYEDSSWGIDYDKRKIFNILEEANSKALSNGGKFTDESFNINQLTLSLN